MNVEVIIEVSIPPEKKNFDSLKRAASRLTNNQKSIAVRATQGGDRVSLITNFTMKTTAQYIEETLLLPIAALENIQQ